MIDSKYVRLVRAIKDYGSISKAARYLNLTQSAVSHQLRKAESEVGLSFFERGGKELVITEAGQNRVTSISELEERIAAAEEAGRKSFLLLIRRGGDPRFVALALE